MKSKDNELKQHANKTFLLLCKTARDLFTFLEFHKKLSSETCNRGYGRSLKRTLTEWYNRQDPMELAVLTMKEFPFDLDYNLHYIFPLRLKFLSLVSLQAYELDILYVQYYLVD
jgi:hypothetical protein